MEHKCTATPVRVTARADGYKPIVREGGGSAGARPVVRAVAHPKAVEADPMRPADSSIERRTPPEAVPGLAAECTSAAAPETEHAVPEEATQGATKEPPWMPPWASAPGASSPTAPRTDPLAVELSVTRRSLREAQKERDVLKSHIQMLQKQIVERAVAESCGARTSRPSSSPTSRSTLHRPASARGASGSKSARKLSEADEKEMLRRLYGKAWAHEAELERKRLEELNEAKIKKVSTKDLEQMVSGLWNSAKEQRRKQDQWRETELAHKYASPKSAKLTPYQIALSASRLQHSATAATRLHGHQAPVKKVERPIVPPWRPPAAPPRPASARGKARLGFNPPVPQLRRR